VGSCHHAKKKTKSLSSSGTQPVSPGQAYQARDQPRPGQRGEGFRKPSAAWCECTSADPTHGR